MTEHRHGRPGAWGRGDDAADRPSRPVPRSRSGMIGRRFPRTGTEPLTARSAVGVRLVLGLLFTPLFLAAALVFAGWALTSGAQDTPSRDALWSLALACGVLCVLAAVDLGVVLRRRRRERGRLR